MPLHHYHSAKLNLKIELPVSSDFLFPRDWAALIFIPFKIGRVSQTVNNDWVNEKKKWIKTARNFKTHFTKIIIWKKNFQEFS